ncbi:diguanylate cyclase [Paenibacillus lemnae]|uniref:Diguanylate cyclase n=1 Tax=Paenibacillus lemnae TaxID=1330551 RepID=A0A848M2N8_PAELE|nr:diguanylate cyclase [Paenibacillus lemnae]
MFNMLFTNFCVLVTFVYLSGILAKKYNNDLKMPSLKVQMVAGLLFGLYGNILMSYSFSINQLVIADFRHLALVIIASYLGWFPTLITGVVIGAGRMVLLGMSTASMIAGTGMMLTAVLCALISRLPGKRLYNMLTMNLAAMTIISLVITLNTTEPLFWVLLIYLVLSIAATLVIYILTEDVLGSIQMFLQMKKHAETDHLTSLNNLRQFEQLLDRRYDEAIQNREKLGVLLVDIDGFKKINDTYGHAAGDVVLQQLSQLLKKHARPMDEVSRNGGEEFTILAPKASLLETAALGEKIRKAVEQHMFELQDGIVLNVTISLGAAVYPDTVMTDNARELLLQADKALYRAKNSGRNRVCMAEAPDENT